MSAIRLVDLFFVPEPQPQVPDDQRPVITMFALVTIKTIPGHTGEEEITFKILSTVGEMTEVGKQTALFTSRFGPEMPGGVTLAIQLNIGVKRLGTAYFCVFIGAEEVARTPFTVTRPREHPNE
jgi:hypothetical protein